MNLAAVMALATPFVSAAVGVVAARLAGASALAAIGFGLGGFGVGGVAGAISVGFANVALASFDHASSQVGKVACVVAYLAAPLVGMGAAIVATVYVVRWLG